VALIITINDIHPIAEAECGVKLPCDVNSIGRGTGEGVVHTRQHEKLYIYIYDVYSEKDSDIRGIESIRGVQYISIEFYLAETDTS
jgi:hypothetical protein